MLDELAFAGGCATGWLISDPASGDQPQAVLSDTTMNEGNRAELEILPNPVTKLMPLVLGMMTLIWGLMASLIPGIPLVGRLIAWAVIIGTLSHLYLTAVRRLVVGEDAVDIELTRKKARIPYSNLDHVTVRAMHLGGMLRVTFVTNVGTV